MSNQPTHNPHAYDANGRPLVPPAERPFVPYQDQETVQETVWLNPTDRDAVLDLYVGTKPVYSPVMKDRWKRMSPPQLREARTGLRRFIIRAGDRRSISSDFDQAIQQTVCQEQECSAMPMYCRDQTHHKMVIGGLGPQLINERVQHRPTVHPSLIEAYALEQAAQQRAIETLRQKEAADVAMAVAHAETLKAAAIRDSLKANEEKAQAQAGASGAKKDK